MVNNACWLGWARGGTARRRRCQVLLCCAAAVARHSMLVRSMMAGPRQGNLAGNGS